MKMLRISIVVLIVLLLICSVVLTRNAYSQMLTPKDYLPFILAAATVTGGLVIGNCWMLFVRQMNMGWVFWLTNFWAVVTVQVLLAIPLSMVINKM